MTWIEDLKNNLVQLINNITGVRVIKANQNAPRPKTDYITLLLSTSSKVGEEQISMADIDGDITIGTDRDLTITLQCISEDSLQILEDLKFDIKKESNLETLRDVEIAYVNAGDVIDITELIGSNEMETRASVDLFFRTAIVATDNVGIVDKVSGKTIMVNPDGSTIESPYTIP